MTVVRTAVIVAVLLVATPVLAQTQLDGAAKEFFSYGVVGALAVTEAVVIYRLWVALGAATERTIKLLEQHSTERASDAAAAVRLQVETNALLVHAMRVVEAHR